MYILSIKSVYNLKVYFSPRKRNLQLSQFELHEKENNIRDGEA